jgi:hypothetical protein
MVDINLMGEEENREEDRQEEVFAKTVNLDVGDTADEEKTSPPQRESMPGSYPRETMGSSFGRTPAMTPRPAPRASRNRAYLLVAALILAALVAVWLMLPSAKKRLPGGRQTVESETGTPGVATTEPESSQALAAVEPGTTPPPASEMETASPLSPEERSLLASTRLGAYTVGALSQCFSVDSDFSLITFYGSNNSFLVEFVAPSSAAISEVTQAMQRNASPEELRTVSQLPFAAQGKSMSNVVVSGKVSERAGLLGPQGGIQRGNFSEFSAWLKQLGSDHGLRLKLFEEGQAYADNAISRTPVRVNFSGSKADIFDFLKGLADAGPSIAISKIIVSSTTRQALSSDHLDLVLHFDFVEL